MPDPQKIDWKNQEESWVVNKLLDNGNDFPDRELVMLTGYLGKNWKREGYWRLYTTLDLTDYVEFNVGDVYLMVKSDTDAKPLSQTMIWLHKRAIVDTAHRVDNNASVKQQQFILGDIVDTFLQSSSTSMPTAPGGAGKRLAPAFVNAGSPAGCGTPTGSRCETPATVASPCPPVCS